MMKKTMLYLLLLLSVLLLAACQKQPQPEIKLPEPQAAASPVQPESAEQTLTLGLIDFEADKELLRGLIQSYNASGAPVRIEIVNYADGAESYADAVTRRTTELMAGNVPDLLDCSDLSGAQYAGYAKNGILLPLDGIPEEGVLSGVQQPCEVEGKRYSIVGAFTLDPLFGPASRLGASLQTSVEDVLRGAVPDVRFVWGGRDLLGVYCRHAAERFLDYDTGTASFESKAFLDLLTACTRIQPSELGPDSIMQQPMRSVSVYRQMQNSWYEQTGDAFRVLSLSADGGVTYQPVLQLGVCTASSVQEAAVQALRAMLTESFQKTIADAFPVSTAVLQAQLQQEIDAQKTYQQTAIREEGRVDVGEAGTQTFLFDVAVAADLMHVLEHVDCRACSNQEILTIILDEADAFFQGRKTAQEAARIMDSRAAPFIAENS